MSSDSRKVTGNIYLSMISSGLAEAITMPLDTIKVNMQARSISGGTHPLLSSVKDIYNQNGLSGFYRSLGASVGRQMLSGGVRLGMYEWMQDNFNIPSMVTGVIPGVMGNLFGGIVQGGACGVVACTASMPLDLVKTRVQAVQGTKDACGVLTMTRRVILQEGVLGFYSGYRQALERSIMISAVQMPVYFGLQGILKNWEDDFSINIRSSLSVLGCTAATTICVYPIDMAKTQIQHNGGRGTLATMIEISRRGGVGSLYRGSTMSFTRALPQFWFTSLIYENLKVYLA